MKETPPDDCSFRRAKIGVKHTVAFL